MQEEKSLRHKVFDNGAFCTLSVHGECATAIASLRRRLDCIVRGEVVRNPAAGNQVLWTNYALSPQFETALGNFATASSCGWRDKRRREIRVYGSKEARALLTALIIEHVVASSAITHAVPLLSKEFEFILQSGRETIDKIKIASRARKVSVDVKHRGLLVQGESIEAKRAKFVVSKLFHGEDLQGSREPEKADGCPICFCEPDDDGSVPVSLSCGHKYCRDCFQTWLCGNFVRDFPLICLAQDCNASVHLEGMKDNIDSTSFLTLLRHSIDDHVRKSPSHLQFCVTPTCPGIVALNPDSAEAVCSTCTMTICTKCDAAHTGMSCEDYEFASRPPDVLRNRIIDEILTLHCPRCNQAFLDFSGCFALQCDLCKCGFCGWCLKDCGHDAHSHVSTCPRKTNPDPYFASIAEFEAAQNKTRKTKIQAFLSKLSNEQRSSTLKAIGPDLKDLGITI